MRCQKWVTGWRLVACWLCWRRRGLAGPARAAGWPAARLVPRRGPRRCDPDPAPDGRQILVDGGPSPTALLDELGEVLPFWDRILDLVVLTHPDADHVSGLIPCSSGTGWAVVEVPQGEKAGAARGWSGDAGGRDRGAARACAWPPGRWSSRC